MIKTTDYWIERWRKSKNFSVEKDRIKPKSYLFSSFPKTNLYGFQDGNIRSIIANDAFSRFNRMIGYNVLFPIGYDSLGLSSFMENKKHSNAINDDICMIFRNQMLRLGTGIDEQKEIDLKGNSYLSSLQLAFIELYEKGYIKYDYISVFQDKSGKKYYDESFENEDLILTKAKVFYLDLSNIHDILEKKINELPLNLLDKTKIYRILNLQNSLKIDFDVTNGTKLNVTLKNPELMGGITYICINPNYIDFALYTLYDEYDSIEKYLTEDIKVFGVFSGTYAINPLTGKKIPIFISDKYKEDIYVGNPAVNIEDREFALMEELEIIDIISNGVLAQSDFLDGYTRDDAKDLIVEAFVDADIATLETYFAKDKILLTSMDAFGALFPFLQDDFGIYSLKDYLPFTFSAKFRPILDDNIDIPGTPMQGSINHIFSSGMVPILALLYDDIGASISIFSKEAFELLESWKGIACANIYENEIMENIFFPLCILSIIEKEASKELPPLYNKILWISPTLDNQNNKMERSNNNLFDIERYLNQYKGDALRLYFLNSKLDEEFIFEENKLAKIANLIKEIEETFRREFVKENNALDYHLFELCKSCLEDINDKNIYSYVTKLLDFFKNNIWKENITKKQALLFIKLLYPIIPFTTEDIYESVFNRKYLISDDGLNV